MFTIRTAREQDAPQITEVFRATYGEEYTYPKYLDARRVKKMIFSDDTEMFVAEDPETGQILGTSSLIMEIGAFSDLVGEFGRLAVIPEARGQGIGTRLMERRLEATQGRLHVGLSETRVVRPYSMQIGLSHGFAPLGFLPMKLKMAQRESAALMVRYFGNALKLRRNNPHIIPEAYALACHSLRACGLPCDTIVDEDSPSYPYNDNFELDELTLDVYANLLRIERGRVRNREIFGPARLHYGFVKLQAKHSTYLLARTRGVTVGAIGFTRDPVEHIVRVFELISLDDQVVRFLLAQLLHKCREDWQAPYVEIDVSAYAPRMQRTLLELGFIPAAYVPALTFYHVERLDLLKMVRLLAPLDLGPMDLLPEVEKVANLVLDVLSTRTIAPHIEAAIDRIRLFRGLSDEQRRRLAVLCHVQTYDAGTLLFAEGEPSEAILILLDGEATLRIDGTPLPGVRVTANECLGEMSLLSSSAHSASAYAATPIEAAVLPYDDLKTLLRRRPDIGVVLYRNLAQELAAKLKRSDRALLQYTA